MGTYVLLMVDKSKRKFCNPMGIVGE